MKKLVFILFLSLFFVKSYATHNRAGEITVRLIDPDNLIYEVVITTYTYRLGVDRPSLIINWGDGTYSELPREVRSFLPNDYQKNVYRGAHSYPGNGIYSIVMEDPNRNEGVLNIPNSVFTVFSVQTIININSETGNINSPELLNPPYDKAALGHPFIHNPAAFDFEGDSLSYQLTICRSDNGLPIANYEFPPATDTLYVDSKIGDLVWQSPTTVGKYNIAMEIIEWRNSIAISKIVRDIQIDVEETENNPPENQNIRDYCVMAGDTIRFNVRAIDPDLDSVKLQFIGGPLELASPLFDTIVTSTRGLIEAYVEWPTKSSHIRKLPYQLLVKSEDILPKQVVDADFISLVDIDNINIRILAPAPEGLQTYALESRSLLRWDNDTVGDIDHFDIYRRVDSSFYTADSCMPGLNSEYGFQLVGSHKVTEDIVDYNEFYDNNKGAGLQPGFNYCYRVVAVYPDGAESYPSNESCVTLLPGIPPLLQVSVLTHDDINGEILVSWAVPHEVSDTAVSGTYEYVIYRGFQDRETLVPIQTIPTTDFTDTVFIDNNINTLEYPYYYSVELVKTVGGNKVAIGTNEVASSFYTDVTVSDNTIRHDIKRFTPWINDAYTYYRSDAFDGTYDSIAQAKSEVFIDTELQNNTEYFYRQTSQSYRYLYGGFYKTMNESHIVSGIPTDTIPPCQPLITSISTDCDAYVNTIRYEMLFDSCYDDVVSYNIYYTPDLSSEWQLLASDIPRDSLVYHHVIDSLTDNIAACYAVSAVDSFSNESLLSTRACIDECSGYELPNIFAPGSDGIADLYIAYNPRNYVDEVEMQIFNRWGNIVFETDDANINWDGRNNQTNKIVSPGVYYYVCVVYEPRITGIETNTLTGFIHVYPDGSEINE